MGFQQWFYGVLYSRVFMRVSLVVGHSREQGQAQEFEMFQMSCIRVEEFFCRL